MILVMKFFLNFKYFRYCIFFTPLVLCSLYLLSLDGLVILGKDTFLLLEATRRLGVGDIPNVDFVGLVGPIFWYSFEALGFIFTDLWQSVYFAAIIWGATVTFVGILLFRDEVTKSTLPLLGLISLSVLVVMTPARFGDEVGLLTWHGKYRDWCSSFFIIVTAFLSMRLVSERQNIFSFDTSFLLCVIIWLCILIKLTYGLALGFIILIHIILFPHTFFKNVRIFLLAFILSTMVFSALFFESILGYLSEIIFAIQNTDRGISRSLKEIVNLPIIFAPLGALIVVLSIVNKISRYGQIRQIIFYGAVLLVSLFIEIYDEGSPKVIGLLGVCFGMLFVSFRQTNSSGNAWKNIILILLILPQFLVNVYASYKNKELINDPGLYDVENIKVGGLLKNYETYFETGFKAYQYLLDNKIATKCDLTQSHTLIDKANFFNVFPTKVIPSSTSDQLFIHASLTSAPMGGIDERIVDLVNKTNVFFLPSDPISTTNHSYLIENLKHILNSWRVLHPNNSWTLYVRPSCFAK